MDRFIRRFDGLSARRHALTAAALTVMLPAVSAFAEEAATPPVVDSGDTAWVLTSSALVLMMTLPGLALFYGGLVRAKNILNVLMQSFVALSIVTVLWVICGYSFAFAPGSPFFGGTSYLMLHGVDQQGFTLNGTGVTVPHQVFMSSR